ncbi:hypothetical protein [Parafrankia sp. EUN1f]|uniref:hypothetical protein n=1 Tax=Parafrankia sp. EUN1f TaxID=102897 RepID=UPI0001C46407|nr:hypothetical protein [Parafrankia sp. EUN1f]EFC81113.1 hypothetical protein FrEUN1fDRAFT_5774 [Parafrankia sp. EUN1f]
MPPIAADEPDPRADSRHARSISGLRTVVEPGVCVPLTDLPPFSIALDGYVQGPALDTDLHRFSFDHHGECLRLMTAATCRQVADALLLGLEPARYTVYVNDLDADTVLATALLARPDLLGPTVSVRAATRALVEAVAGRDALGPAYPVTDPALLAAFARRVPLPAPGAALSAEAMSAALAECVSAVVAFLVESTASPAAKRRLSPSAMRFGSPSGGRAVASTVTSGSVDGHRGSSARHVGRRPRRRGGGYVVTHRGTGWIMARGFEQGVFESVYAEGYLRAVVWSERPDGSVAYTVGRRSDLVAAFPVGPAERPGTILAALAARERGWGGGSTVGGAPRHSDGRRSVLRPDEVFALVEAVVVGG